MTGRGVIQGALALFSLGALATAGPAAACQLQFADLTVGPSAVYRPFDGRSATIALELSFSPDDAVQDCADLQIAVRSTFGALRSGSSELVYELDGASSGAIDHRSGAPAPLSGLEEGAGRARRIDLTVASQQLAPPGSYADTFVVDLRRGDEVLDTRTVDVALDVAGQSIVQVSVAGGSYSSSAAIDFGVLEQGESRDAFLRVGSNSAYNISITSDNNGRMVHQDPDVASAEISYLSYLGGAALDLQSVASAPFFFSSDGLNDRGLEVHRLNFIIGDVSGRPAGEYLDTVRIRVTALE